MRRLALLLVLLASNGAAQGHGVVWGTVSRMPDGKGVEALVVANSEEMVWTDSLGRYVFRDIPRGPVTLRVWAHGYYKQDWTVTLQADSLKADALLTPNCGPFGSRLSVVSRDRGEVVDLPALNDKLFYSEISTQGRSVAERRADSVTERMGRTAAWQRRVGDAGQLTPWAPGLGAPQPYVDGLPTLSLDGVPVYAAEEGGAFAGYAPVRLGGAPAGVAAVTVSSYPSVYAEGFGGAVGLGPGGSVRAGVRHIERLPYECGREVWRAGLGVDTGAAASRSRGSLEIRALADVRRRTDSVVGWGHSRVGGRGGEAQIGGVATVEVASGSFGPLVTAGASGSARHRAGAGEGLAAFRVDLPSRQRPLAAGVEGRIHRRESREGRAGTESASALAAYGELRGDLPIPGRMATTHATYTVGARVERWATSRAAAPAAVAWSVQPRALAQVVWRRDKYAYGYASSLAAPGPDGLLTRRHEVGGGAAWAGRVEPHVTLGLHPHLRVIDGARDWSVYGADATLGLEWHRGVGNVAVDVRAREEWGDPTFAARRWVAQVSVGHTAYLPGRVGAYVDAGEWGHRGGTRRRLVEVGVVWTPEGWGPIPWGLEMSASGVVSGRASLPCEADDPLGLSARCAVPAATVLVRAPL